MSIAVEPGATRLAVTIGEKEISFETGAVAKQAHGAVLVQQEGTVVLATAVGRTEGREADGGGPHAGRRGPAAVGAGVGRTPGEEEQERPGSGGPQKRAQRHLRRG